MSAIQQLCGMGFEAYWAQYSLKLCNNNVNNALEWLLSDKYETAKHAKENNMNQTSSPKSHDNSEEYMMELQSMGYNTEYISRAISVHKQTKFGTNYSISLLEQIIVKLQKKDKDLQKQSSKFMPHFMSMFEAFNFNKDDLVDYRFPNGKYILCKIIDIKIYGDDSIMELLLHPIQKSIDDKKWDQYCQVNDDYIKLAPARIISMRKIKSEKHMFFNIRINDFIDINPLYREGHGHKGWKNGKIIKMDNCSSQVKVVYFNDKDRKNYSYWVHLENNDEVAEFRSKYKGIDKGQVKAEHLEHELWKNIQDMNLNDSMDVKDPEDENLNIVIMNNKKLKIKQDFSTPKAKDNDGEEMVHHNFGQVIDTDNGHSYIYSTNINANVNFVMDTAK